MACMFLYKRLMTDKMPDAAIQTVNTFEDSKVTVH